MEEEKIEKTEEIKKIDSSYKKTSVHGKMKENPWIVSTLVLGIIALILLAGNFGNMTGGTVGVASQDTVAEQILELANSQVGGAELVSVNEKSGLYEVVILLQGQEVPVYVTKDGENLVGGLTPLSLLLQQSDQASSDTTQSTTVPTSDKPVVELFVMTYCPYGTQAEKGIISAIQTLANTIDAKIRFVHYFMHGDKEEQETYTQICIREEQASKFYDYLKCFLEDSDSGRCLTEAKIDKPKLDTCISSGKAKEYYAEDSALSESYGVGGSPTLVINGVQSSAGRDSASYLAGICSAFNSAPDKCNTALSSASPSPGFGWGETTSATTAQC